MRPADKALARLRQLVDRLASLLEHEDRNALLQAEITHQAAHMSEHFGALDKLLTGGGELPSPWQKPQQAQEAP